MNNLPNKTFPYRNVMEILVERETMRQLQYFPRNIASNIEPIDAIAYALNHLSHLYATTQEGWVWHHKKAERSMADEISEKVRLGLNRARQKNKLFSTPIKDDREAEMALQALKVLLDHPDLSWHNLVNEVQNALQKNQSHSATFSVPNRRVSCQIG